MNESVFNDKSYDSKTLYDIVRYNENITKGIGSILQQSTSSYGENNI